MVESDRPDIQALFSTVFGETMSDSLWQWKYGEQRGFALIARHQDGRLIGHYGGACREILFKGQRMMSFQSADVMVAPESRGILTRNGVFSSMTRDFANQFVGYGNPYIIGFGFPNQRHLKIGQHHQLYAEVDSVHEVCWPLQKTKLPWFQFLEPLEKESSYAHATLDKLWHQQASSSKDCIIPIRDYKHWKHRFLHRPHIQYATFLLKEKIIQRPLGALVIRRNAADPGSIELMDLIGPLKHMPMLLHAARHLAGQEHKALKAWLSQRPLEKLRTEDCVVHDIGVRVPTQTSHPGPSVDELRNQWWLTGGDTDFR